MSKKEELIESALNLFASKGYDNVGVQKIVESVGVQKPTLYYYFKSKEGLLDAILTEKFLPFLNELKKINYNGDIVLTLENIIFKYFDFAKQNSNFYRIILNLTFAPENSQAYNLTAEYLKKEYLILENIFLEAEKQHGNMKGKSKMFSYSFLGIINSAITYYFHTKNKQELNIINAQILCKQFMHGIFS
ncbi:TetR family transcriptional regulator [Hypnocyclicus thermotrophus]|uniref:TetR family transcriptional regulator n=1 Tax=Hypnocyclicus thermotrophus TaxID=1627895 RepID=A0AA46E017_9FUSO|nr:TetR/AcrR family transcriptional regulator [Hypnocyclicus thermotrophus]TDT72024.1 TetR family transcriptional regulator [Hypnocyclicus thermotrophus]